MMLSTASKADLPLLAHVEASQHYPWTDNQLASCFDSGYRVRLLWQGDEVVGFSICQRVLDESTLFNLCVLPQCRGLGYGKVLMADLIEDAKAASDSVIFLEVRASNQTAIGLYLASGFSEVGRRKGYYRCHDGREDAVVMALSLS